MTKVLSFFLGYELNFNVNHFHCKSTKITKYIKDYNENKYVTLIIIKKEIVCS